ncbi:RDD family protein [Rickettsiales endosymbiont of Stachyamoeba lipophora]|uniref:RDD family protein n=1 Tax=Rickettsiales endosymbiont of Stachyamoeba lipophora TaxID=2486578 RepID=UPI000F64598A|nr:RDD family protein [Rickettsiales endosymbiont of Stachyamoeba lipophora]AZL15383.1 RDD family protein [Rickettsiales endosymbiont of Stachyamoeba lipophora]
MKFIERILISKSQKDDSRLGKFPSEFEGYKISYPKLPIRLLMLLVDLLVVTFLVVPLVSTIERLAPDDERINTLKFKYQEYYKEYEGNREKIIEALEKDPAVGDVNALTQKVIIKQVGLNLILFAGFIGYILLCQKYFKRTLGQRIFNVRILHRVTYQPASFKQIVLRSFLSLLTLATALIGFFIAVFNPRHITLHDYLSNTVVIRLSGRI